MSKIPKHAGSWRLSVRVNLAHSLDDWPEMGASFPFTQLLEE